MSDKKLIIIMVGLPARGKSYISNNLSNYLNWVGLNTKVFNSGTVRRTTLSGIQTSDFFNSKNRDLFKLKESISMNLFDKLLNWLYLSGDIAIFDSTNSTLERRNNLLKKIAVYNSSNENCVNSLFIELECNNKIIINKNISLKQLSLDYKNMTNIEAIEDFNKRIEYYKDIYERINDNLDNSFIRINKDTNIISTKYIRGVYQTTIMSYLLNIRITNTPIYLSRHGESLHNTLNKLGGDSKLSKRGELYSSLLYEYMTNEIKDIKTLKIYTSTLKRTNETVALFNNHTQYKVLDEINAGICSNMTPTDIGIKYPDILKCRELDKLNYRYPEGESYRDLCERLQNFVYKIESRQQPLLIVSHRAVNRVLLSYFVNINSTKMPHIAINLGEVIKLIPNSTGYSMEVIKLE
tara:strand:+ start:16423 stop:17649 length:1227 start_codon:yes stop_codon:yes gene_type:complete